MLPQNWPATGQVFWTAHSGPSRVSTVSAHNVNVQLTFIPVARYVSPPRAPTVAAWNRDAKIKEGKAKPVIPDAY
jgi:hypothetical protein